MSKFYITTSIVYTNANPHLGYALELTQADVLARYHRLILDGTHFLTGTDEHGFKIYQAAQKSNVAPQEFVDAKANRYVELTQALTLSNNDFIRTSDKQRHYPGAQKLWEALVASDDIYLKKYTGLYSVRAERFVTQKELDEDGGKEHSIVEDIEEENYFFKLSKYQDQLLELIANDTIRIVPESKKAEMIAFIQQGLEDVSFSRATETLPWGIQVPNDPSQVMYVWCDALTNYISALGYGQDEPELLDTFWPADVHLVGKDIIRFHALYWPAMLLSANLPLPKNIFVHGFITVDGQKMSKSIGNVIDPFEFIEEFGTDAFRYFMLRELPTTEDGDFSRTRFIERYNDDLANGLGNLVSRVAKLCERSGIQFSASPQGPKDHPKYSQAIDNFQLNIALEYVWHLIREADQFVEQTKPWQLDGKPLEEALNKLVADILTIATLVEPFIPTTAAKILAQYSAPHIKSTEPLFPRLDK